MTAESDSTMTAESDSTMTAGSENTMSSDSPEEKINDILGRISYATDGLIPAVIQEASTSQVLMLGYMNAEAVRRTLTEGRVTFWSRSRQEFWRKGDTSGHAQYVHSVALDCDADTLLVIVEQIGSACHTGAHSCFDVDLLPAQRGLRQ